jgi:pimeloyl-ACP methyl ester carboxylesterase
MAPARVTKLVLVDAAGYAFEPQQLPLGFALARLPLLRSLGTSLTPRALTAHTLQSLYGHPERVTSEQVDRHHALLLREGNRGALLQRLRQREAEAGRDSGLLRTLAMPTLILWGGRDRLVPPDTAHRFQRDIARSRLVMFDDLGHMPQEEDPRRTVTEVQRFLSPCAQCDNASTATPPAPRRPRAAPGARRRRHRGASPRCPSCRRAA